MAKYRPLQELHQLVQLTHSTTGRAIFYSQVHLRTEDKVDEDEAGGWVLSAFTGKTYFEREYRRDDLDDLIITTGDKDWASFAKRFKTAVQEGYFHIVDMSSRECKVIVDNDVHSRSSGNSSALETIEIDMFPVNHATRGEKMGDFMFECATYFQTHGCVLNSGSSAAVRTGAASASASAVDVGGAAATGGKSKSNDDLKLERDSLRSENAELKQEIERLHAQVLKSGGLSQAGLGAAHGRSKSKSAQAAMMSKEHLLKKRKGISALNPRIKKGVVAKGTEFGSDEEAEED